MPHTTLLSLLLAVVFIVSVTGNDGFLVLRGTNEHQISSIDETNVADLITHVSGLAPVHQNADRSEFPQKDLFKTPSANLFVAIDSVTHDTLVQLPGFFYKEGDKPISIVKSSYPEDPLSTLTTVLTGETHEIHGIVGNSWKASRDVSVEAFSAHGKVQSARIADRIAVASQGGARILSIAGSKKLVSAIGVHTELMDQHPEWNCKSLYYSRQRGMVSLYDDETYRKFSQIKYNATLRGMTITTAAGHMLATELMAISMIPEQMKRLAPSGVDGVPDMITVGIKSIKEITLKFGADSQQVVDAWRYIDMALAEMYPRLQELYDGDIVTEIVGLQSSLEEHTFYTQNKQRAKLALDDPTGTTDDSNTYTADDVTAFQTQLWISVALLLALLGSVYALVKMDMLEDSLIYRTTDGPRPIMDVR